jgi:hypothetical protein
MTERGLVAFGIFTIVAIACAVIAILFPPSRRVLWIIGLSIALIVFGGYTTVCVIALISRGHLNSKGALSLLANGYVTWIVFRYLSEKVRTRVNAPQAEARPTAS